jgi:1-acyl-sn-glycerol-3-phosphate acyltransferase
VEANLVRWLDSGYGRDPRALDPVAVERTVGRLRAAARWLPWLPVRATGLEHVPPPPAMIVMNHSGGTSIPDVWGFMYAWYSRFGVSRPLHPLAHEMVLGQPMTGPYFARRGVLLADRGVARAALELGHDVLVLPGGDQDAWRPWSERWQVRFAGRRGYARLAVATGVPVVPVAHAGAHETLLVLFRGQRLARLAGLHRLTRAEIWPVHLSLPWGLAIGPLPHIPWPRRLRYQVGREMDPRAAGGVEALDAAVQAAVQRGLDELRQGR